MGIFYNKSDSQSDGKLNDQSDGKPDIQSDNKLEGKPGIQLDSKSDNKTNDKNNKPNFDLKNNIKQTINISLTDNTNSTQSKTITRRSLREQKTNNKLIYTFINFLKSKIILIQRIAKRNFFMSKFAVILITIFSIIIFSIGVYELMPNKSYKEKNIPPALQNISSIVEMSEIRYDSAIISQSIIESNKKFPKINNMKIKKPAKDILDISWNTPKQYNKNQLIMVRKNSGIPVQTLKDGKKINLKLKNNIVDNDIKVNQTYSYALFYKKAKIVKPIILSSMTINTRLKQSELPLNDFLANGNMLISENGKYNLIMDGSGNLKLTTNRGVSLWSPITGEKINNNIPVKATLTSNGNFQVANEDQIFWQTNTTGSKRTYLKLTDDGNLKLIDNGKTLWLKQLDVDLSIGDDYPFHNGSPLGYSPNNCTDYVAWRLNESAGVKSPPWKFFNANMTPRGGNAGEWILSLGNKMNTTPGVGSVAWWGAGTVSALGHVAYVTKVYKDGSIDIEEYNYVTRHTFDKRHLIPGTSDFPQKFIHINDII